VEVINFGVKGYGMYQSVLMHEYLGKKYDLDYAVFMLLGIHTRRDYSFIKDREGCVGVHARYIFKDNKLEFIPTVGENRKEASLNYFRMFPPIRYIRYDKKPPSFMRALLPPGRDWKFNPFYYNPQELANHELILNSYALLFQKAARATGQVVVIANDDFMSRLAKIVKSPNVYVLKSRMVPYLNWGFYLAPRSHRSAMGNDLQARELFTLLTGGKKPEIPVLEIRETEPGGADPGLAVEPIGHYENVSVNLGGNPAGALTKMMNTSVRITKEIDLSEEKVTGLLFLSHAQMSFLPLDFRVKQGEPVYLLFRKGRDFVRRAIGKMDTRSGVVSRILWSGYQTDNEIIFQMKEGLIKIDREMSGISIKTPEKVKDVQILIGNKKVLDGKRQETMKGKKDKQGDNFEWDTKKKLFYLRASSGQYFQIESMVPEKGLVELVLSRGNGQETHLPTFLEYEVAKPAFRPFYPAYSNNIRQGKG
ncbi:MAG TPA: hypothetical protein VD913_06400, partial [bacterium]|nr:hypothetical protein [bacterium]